MFDEGIFVDANYSVDVFDCIIICTTNYKSEEEAVKNLGEPKGAENVMLFPLTP